MPHARRRCSTRVWFIFASVALFLVAIAPTFAAPPNAPAKTPQELIAKLLEAAHAGDVDRFLALLTESSRDALTKSTASRDSLRHADDAFVQALNRRFGEGLMLLAPPADDLKAALGRIAEAQLLSQKPSANGDLELRVKTTITTPSGPVTHEETLLAHPDGGGWKAAIGFPDDAAVASAQIAAAEQITRQVNDGKYPDRQSAMIALSNAWSSKERK